MNNILNSIGNTPLLEIKRLNSLSSGTRLLAKVEGVNPGGSIKDRPALYMIQAAEKAGMLSEGKIIIEPTSGNTGIAIAMIGAALGYRVKIFIPACVSSERRAIIEAMGAEIELTPSKKGTDGAIRRAQELLEESPGFYYMPDQFSNPYNVLAHYETTGPEIYRQTAGEIDVFVAGIGTSGTLMGTSRYLKEINPKVKIFGVEPTIGHKIQGLKNLTESVVPEIYDRSRLDGIVTVSDEEAFEMARQLALKEGIFAGMSSGAALAGALKVGREFPGATIVAILPDRGERYLSTSLFRSVCGKCPP